MGPDRRRRIRRAVRRDERVEVTLVDRRNHFLFSPLLDQTATCAVSPADMAQPLRSILRRQRNTTVLLGEAVDLDPSAATSPADPALASIPDEGA